jgi:AAA+ superfamily predicted ATPase
MRKPKSNPVLEAIEQVYTSSKNCRLETDKIPELSKHLKTISKYLGVSQNEAYFFSLVISENFFGNNPDLGDFCRFLDTNAMKIIAHMESFDRLIERNFLHARNGGRRHSENISNRCYFVHQEIISAIMDNAPMPAIEPVKTNNTLEILGLLYELIDSRMEGEINMIEFRKQLIENLNKYAKFQFIKSVKELQLSPQEKAVYIWTIWKSLMGNRSVDIENLCRAIYHSPSATVGFLQSLKNGTSNLVRMEIIECREAKFLNDIELAITPKTAKMLEKDGIIIKLEMSKREGLIVPDKIGEKNLFYNEAEKVQISSVKSMLDETRYQELMNRLKKKGLPLSMNILLYGAPGTGKTESVLQLAKATGREIIKVEISQMKSMWFGESEKIIKKVFTDYAEYCKHSKLTPILLFNEADAILSTRNQMNGGSTRQTENAIQNILLEELENFKGIFMATTNLVQNLDKAFERRFLFKVEFKKPSVESRCRIWMDRIPGLSEEDAMVLANNFELSGGQIENIVRKCEIEYIINGEEANLQDLMRFCKEENVSGVRTHNRIGF